MIHGEIKEPLSKLRRTNEKSPPDRWNLTDRHLTPRVRSQRATIT
jgi:hypothetical protein